MSDDHIYTQNFVLISILEALKLGGEFRKYLTGKKPQRLIFTFIPKFLVQKRVLSEILGVFSIKSPLEENCWRFLVQKVTERRNFSRF